jgi:predicted AAA+ superfamily ATPase
MNKDLIKFLIAEYQREAVNVSLIERPYPLEDTLNYVFIGLRRAGKSYLMFQQIQHLLRNGRSTDEILYFNFEDDRITSLGISDLELIRVCYEEMYDCQPVFFLDGIQIVTGWEKFARRLADRGYRVYLTGSNAKMLSSEITATLDGRFMIQNVYPFTFGEYLSSSGLDMYNKDIVSQYHTEIAEAYETYFRFGGLPELMYVSGKREWLSNLYQKVILGDLIARYRIGDDLAFRLLVRKLAESVKQLSSFNRLANGVSATGKKMSTDTVIDYLGYLKEIWLLFSIENFHAKLAEKEGNKKFYFIDNGLLHLFLLDPLTSLLENQVAIQLRRLYGEEVYFYNNGTEVDFYVPEIQLAVQVCYSLNDLETQKREVHALLQVAKRIDIKKMIIITKDEEGVLSEEGRDIEIVPVWKWLIGE